MSFLEAAVSIEPIDKGEKGEKDENDEKKYAFIWAFMCRAAAGNGMSFM